MQSLGKKFWHHFRIYSSWFLGNVIGFGKWLRREFLKTADYLGSHPADRKRAIIFGPVGFFFLVLFFVVLFETPSIRKIKNIRNQVASEVYSADSVLLGRYYIQDRTEVKYEDIAPVIFDALISTEDVRFYQHTGVDFKSLGRVLVKSIFLQDESSGGGSTLTQQLVKNLYPRKRYWILSMLINKMREVITASRLEIIYTKKELITLYLNTVPFSDNAFGIQTAALRFYSTTADSIRTDQAAVLIGMLKATTSYNPRLFPDRALQRRNVVLAQMVKNNVLSEDKADSLKALPIELRYNRTTHHHGLAPYFREYLKAELLTWCKNNRNDDGEEYNLYTDGLKIYTTLDSRLQHYAEQAVAQQMAEVQKQFFDHWGKEKPWKGKEEVLEEAIHRSSRYKVLKEQGLSDEEILIEMEKPIPMKLFSWQGVQEAVVSPVDSIVHHLQYLNAGFLAMEPSTGMVKAWVGGIDHDFFQYDHVKTSTKRQVGSIFKPIVYATAIEAGIAPCDLIPAGQQTYIDKEGEKWTPRNMQNDYQVQYTMRGGLAYSVNTIAVKLIDKAGVDNTIAMARKMGITSELPDVPSIALGSSSISLMEMTTAFACFANQGMSTNPYYISSITDQYGKMYSNFKSTQPVQQAMASATAQLVTALLKTVVHEGTAARIRWKYGVLNDMGGKTGTTQSNADGWFMAITPGLVMGSWVGADDPRIRFRSSKLGQGSNTALPITGYFLSQLNKDTNFRTVTDARFAQLPALLQQKLDCDLYELSDELKYRIQLMAFKRDSLMRADTLAVIPDESFLETIYKRKMKMIRAQELRDSLRIEIVEDLGG
ncbi:MAG: transglycosylase domain-containing protein [Cyclobacteriaceae bacterium]|nr:transglycosylase domain-containing protein [Cyclobacteriaceae bacterium]